MTSKHSLEEDIATAMKTTNQIGGTEVLLENEIDDDSNLYYPSENPSCSTHYESSGNLIPETSGQPNHRSFVLPSQNFLRAHSGNRHGGLSYEIQPNHVISQALGTQDLPARNLTPGLLSGNLGFQDQQSSGSYSCYSLASNHIQPSFQDIAVELSKKIDVALKKMEELTERVTKLEEGNRPQGKCILFNLS